MPEHVITNQNTIFLTTVYDPSFLKDEETAIDDGLWFMVKCLLKDHYHSISFYISLTSYTATFDISQKMIKKLFEPPKLPLSYTNHRELTLESL